MLKLGKISEAVFTVGLFSVFTRILSFIFKIYLSRTLGAEVIGLYQIATSVFFLFASFSSSGLPLVLSRKTAQDIALGENKYKGYFSSALFIGISISMLVIMVIWTFSNSLGFLFSDKNAIPIFFIMLPALLSTTIYGIIRGFLWGNKQFLAFSATETVEELLRIVFSVMLISGVLFKLDGKTAIAIAFTASDMIVAIILIIIFFVKSGKISRPCQLKDIFTPSIPITSMRIFSSMIATLIAIILPLKLLDFGMSASEATASYGRIAGMANPLLLAPNALISSLAIVLIPEMSANGIKKEYNKLNQHLTNGINLSLLISGLFVVIYLSLGEEITTLLYKDSISGQYLSVACVVMIPMCISQLTQSALNSMGKEFRSFFNYLFGNIVMIIAIFILPPYIGIYSVAVATLLCLLITSICNVVSLHKITKGRINCTKNLLLITAFIIPCALICEWLNNIMIMQLGALSVIISCVISIGLYFVLCFGFKLIDIKGFVHLKKVKANPVS
ncbi:MAG: oligosaccharide flippase family protein [Clostridia bacterium]